MGGGGGGEYRGGVGGSGAAEAKTAYQTAKNKVKYKKETTFTMYSTW